MTAHVSYPVTEPVISSLSLSERLLVWLVPGAFWVLALGWAAVNLLPPVNFDEALILAISERWLGGERLYIDLIDVNPPLIFVLNLVPAIVERITGISGPVALVLSILTLIAVSIRLSLKMIPLVTRITRDGATELILPPLIVIALVIFPGDMFGQREHLMAVALIPYMLLAAARIQEVPIPLGYRIGIAVFGAVGLAIKPHFLAIAALIELFVLVKRGSPALRDLVPWLMAGLFVSYAIAIWIWLPQYYFSVVPLVMSAYEKIGTASSMTILLGNQLAPALIALVPFGIAAFLGRFSALIRVVVLAGLGASISGVVQGKGWSYHLLPAQIIEVILAGLMAAALIDSMIASKERYASEAGTDRSSVGSAARAMVGLVLLMFVSLSIYVRSTFYDQWGFQYTAAAQLTKIVKPYAEGKSILVLSPGVYPIFPMLNYAHAKMALRFETIWPLQGAYSKCVPTGPRYHSPKDVTPSERVLDQAVAEDFAKYRPPLVIIDKIAGISRCDGKDFDLFEYFLHQPQFAAEMDHYDFLTQYDRYMIYKRRPISNGNELPHR
jgi:hypothetical protein